MADAADRLAAARADPDAAVLDGFHALKHALRFGAELLGAWTADPAGLARLAAQLAPDLDLDGVVEPVAPAALGAHAHHTAVLAVARRPRFDAAAVGAGRVVLLEDPRHLGNVGAVIRVAAAAGAAAVLTTGPRDPWDRAALRGSAGLHFALPVGRVEPASLGDRPLVAVDPGGAPLGGALPADAVLAFGTERHGLSGELLARADARVGIPMRPGVSSLNLATAVAVVLYQSGASSSSAST
jgi:TrmH family RNA methyltransferase